MTPFTPSSTTGPDRWQRLRALTPAQRDALLYGCSTLFALWIAMLVSIPLYRQWGRLAVAPYALATLVALIASRRPLGADRWRRGARIAALAIAFFGATVAPLGAEVVWRVDGPAALHVQPEVVVVERAGARVEHGLDPYQLIDRGGHVILHTPGLPTYEQYFPYLPGIVIFGLASGTHLDPRLTDARLFFLLFTVVVGVVALSRIRPPTDARWRALQVLGVLPTAALPLATGGDDMPVVAMMLMGLVALQRRWPLVAGLALGLATSFKFTSWPLAALALLVVEGNAVARSRARMLYLLGAAVILVPTVLPVALHDPAAFVDNVVRFPLGLAGISSPAASALPGHIFVSLVPSLHKAYVVVGVVVGMVALVVHVRRRPPVDASGLARLVGWVMLIAILLAPATRVGYLLYPINLFTWSWMLDRNDTALVSSGAAVASSSG